MKRKFFPICLSLVCVVVLSCGHQGKDKISEEAANRIMQQEDGTVALKLEKADCYNDDVNPSNNTADWNVVISKPGRFKVWLSSATKDTSDLSYSTSVKVNILNDHLEVNPEIDKVVLNSEDVPETYFRADSYVGSFYIPEPGEYNIQVISDKILARNSGSGSYPVGEDTMLMSVMLTPAIR